MSRLGAVTLQFGDGEYEFRLRIKQLIELDEKCEVGPQAMLNGLLGDTWRLAHVREIIRLGLIGGGLTPKEAYDLVKRYVDERPLQESAQHALVILAAAVVGMPEDSVPEKSQAPAETGEALTTE